jgi:transcriptional regulator with XRE-family HTH domain
MVFGMISAAQCRAARGLINWTQEELAAAAQVGIVTVRQFEGEKGSPRSATLAVIRQALEAAGVQFIAQNGGGPGVRLQRNGPPDEGLKPSELTSENDG